MNWIIQTIIKKRTWVVIATILLALLSIVQLQSTRIDVLPDITNTQVQVNTVAPGLSSLEVERQITYLIENKLLSLPYISHTRSLSRYGLSQVTIIFKEGVDIYFARNLVNQQLSNINQSLPDGVSAQMAPVSSGLGEVFLYTLHFKKTADNTKTESEALTSLREIQDWIIKPQLLQVKGVVEVNSIGGYEKQFHVLPDIQKMLFHEISMQDIVSALQKNNQNRSAAYIEKEGQQLSIRIPGKLSSIEDIKNVHLATAASNNIQIRDIAEVRVGKQLRTGAATHNASEAVIGTVMMLIGEDANTVAQNIAKKIQAIQAIVPTEVIIEPLYNRANLVDRVITTITENLLIGALLVIVILFLLLNNLRAACITAAIIPLSMLMTLSVMAQSKISVNLMSLGALDFGLIIDGAVIIIENIVRKMEDKTSRLSLQQRLQLTYQATIEVIRPSFFGVLIITLVYIPIFSLGGVEGKMFHPMAAAVVTALLSAMLLCFTFIPAAAALFLKPKKQRTVKSRNESMKLAYRAALSFCMRIRVFIVCIMLGAMLFASYIFYKMGSEFVPQLNEGDFAVQVLRTPGSSLSHSIEMQKLVEKTIRSFPQVQMVFSRIGTAEIATDPMPVNIADTIVILKPKSQWPSISKQQLIQNMRNKLLEIPSNQYEFTQPIQLRFNELISGVRANVGIKLFGDDIPVLLENAQKIEQSIKAIPGASDVRIEQINTIDNLAIIPDPIALNRYSLQIEDLQNWVNTAIGANSIGSIYQRDRNFALIVKLKDEIRSDIAQLGQIPVILPNGDYVPLQELARISIQQVPAQISRENGKRKVIINANVEERDLGSFVYEVQNTIKTMNLPSGYWVEYGGTFEQLKSASETLSVITPTILAIIFFLLYMALGSIKDSMIIFTAVPFALIGGILLLSMRGMPFSISAAVGFIALSGIAILNALVMVSAIRQLYAQSTNLYSAIIRGALLRLRPILMTALVASLGFIPMALNTGIGAEVQKPLATVIIGGIVSATSMTLFVLPILYWWAYRARDVHLK